MCPTKLHRDELVDCLTKLLVSITERNSEIRPSIDTCSLFDTQCAPAIQLGDYITRIHEYAVPVNTDLFVIALVYLDRIVNSGQVRALTHFNAHRLVFTSCVIACKIFDGTAAVLRCSIMCY